MAFLRNRTINLMNLHSGGQALAQGMGGLFVLVFLLRAGISVPASLCAIALIFAGRFAIRPVVLVFAQRWGLKPTVIFGNLVIALQYPILAEVHAIGWPLLAYCLISSLGDTFYWASYHAYFASLGDNEHRGHQIGAREALAAVVGIVAPLIGAWCLISFGARITFAAVGAVQALAAVPLLGTPNVAVQRVAPGAYRAAFSGIGLFIADGWSAVMYACVWKIELYQSLGNSLSAYGGAMALAALVGALSGMLLGRYIDAGHGRRAVFIAYSVAATTFLLCSASFGIPWLAITANAIGAFSACLQIPAMMTAVYNLAKASPCTMRFHMAAEAGWDIGGGLGCLVAAGLAAYYVPLGAILALGLLGLAASVVMLNRYYRANSLAIEAAATPEILATHG